MKGTAERPLGALVRAKVGSPLSHEPLNGRNRQNPGSALPPNRHFSPLSPTGIDTETVVSVQIPAAARLFPES